MRRRYVRMAPQGGSTQLQPPGTDQAGSAARRQAASSPLPAASFMSELVQANRLGFVSRVLSDATQHGKVRPRVRLNSCSCPCRVAYATVTRSRRFGAAV